MPDHILYEGETEKKLLKILCAEGKKTKFNPFQNEIRKLLRLINKTDTVYIVYDIDVMNNAAISKFNENIKKLLKITKKIILVQQTRNMEEELQFACNSVSLVDIYKAFSAEPPTASNFKSRFISSNSCIQILEGLGFDENKLFTRQIDERISEFYKYLGKPKYRK